MKLTDTQLQIIADLSKKACHDVQAAIMRTIQLTERPDEASHIALEVASLVIGIASSNVCATQARWRDPKDITALFDAATDSDRLAFAALVALVIAQRSIGRNTDKTDVTDAAAEMFQRLTGKTIDTKTLEISNG